MGWGDVDKKEKRGSLSGRFVQFEEGVSVRMRIVDEEPYTTRVHKISMDVVKGGKKEEVFRSIPATSNPDDNYILKTAPKNRYPDVQQFNLRVAVYKDQANKDSTEFEIKILQGGPAIFKPLRQLYTEHGHLNQFDIIISRAGKQRETEYTVTAAPFSRKINVDEAVAALASDEALSDWSAVFPEVTGAEQEKMVKDAGFDIAYDPAAAIAAGMGYDDAKEVEMPFGKYKGKKIGEIVVIDSSWLSWAADNVTSNDRVAAACRVAVAHMGQVTSGQSVAPAALPKAKEEAPAAAAPKADPKRRDTLLEAINDRFEQDPRFEDIDVMVTLVKKHSGGKTRVKDLTVEQLESLNKELTNG